MQATMVGILFEHQSVYVTIVQGQIHQYRRSTVK